MENQPIGEKILQTIKEKHITPKPKWQFLLKNYFVWGSGVVALIIGGFAFAVIIHMVVNNDWDVYEYINDSLLAFIFVSLPYLWLLFLIIFILLAHYYFKHTKKGYQFRLSTIVAISIASSALLGVCLYEIGIGQALHEVLSERIPIYRQYFSPRHMIWASPEHGRLSGVIIVVIDEDHFQIKDFTYRIWEINAEQAVKPILIEIKTGNRIRMIGRPINQNIFKAERIMPWLPPQHPMPERKMPPMRINQ